MKCFTSSLVAAAWAASLVSVALVGEANAESGDDSSRAIAPGKAVHTVAVASRPHGLVVPDGRPLATMRLSAGEGSSVGGAAYSSQLPAWFREAGVCTWGGLKGCNRVLAYVERPGGRYWIPVTLVGAVPFNSSINKQLARSKSAEESAELGPLYAGQPRSAPGTLPVSDLGSSIVKTSAAGTVPSAAAVSATAFSAFGRSEALQVAHNTGLEGFFGIDLPADAAISEPPAYAMLLAGLGMFGFIFLRRINHS